MTDIDFDDPIPAALWAIRRGFKVHPLDHPELPTCVGIRTTVHDPGACVERGKHPATKWGTEASADPHDVAAWFSGAMRNVGLAVPSGLIVVDEDTPGGLGRAAQDAQSLAPPTLTWPTGRGRHYIYRLPEGLVHGNKAGRLKTDYGCDIRGFGGYVVGPGSLHETGNLYGPPDDPDADIAAAPEWLIKLITEEHGSSSGGAFAGLPEVIKGPREGASGDRHGVLISYASSLRAREVPMPEATVLFRHAWSLCEQPPACLSPLPWDEAKAKLEDVYNRYPAGRSAAYTTPDISTFDPGPPPSPEREGEKEEPATATWARTDLTAFLDGTYVPRTPEFMPRSDGVCLLYPQLVHSLHGESESGKSWVAQAEAARLLIAGRPVLYIDFESDAGSIVERLVLLSVPTESITELFDYRRPEVSPSSPQEIDAWRDLLSGTYDLAVIDGVTDSLGMFGSKTTDNDEISMWMRAFPRRVARHTGAAVVLIDHVTKNTETRGRFAIGGQAKMAGLDGSAYVVDVSEPLGKGLRGVLTLRVAKDRPGYVRGRSGPMRKSDRTQESARFVLDATQEPLTAALLPPAAFSGDQDGGAPFRPTGLMEKASRWIEAPANAGATKNRFEAGVGGNAGAVREAIECLVAEGFVRREQSGQSMRHWSVSTYRQVDDPQSDRFGLDAVRAPVASLIFPEPRPRPASPVYGGDAVDAVRSDVPTASMDAVGRGGRGSDRRPLPLRATHRHALARPMGHMRNMR